MELIAKKYRVLKSLGTGAMGEVFLVLPPRGDPVALKLLKSPEAAESGAALAQFENEFKVLKKLSHPNIGKIFDYGYDEELKKVFFTSPWLRGTDLYVSTQDLAFDKCEEYFVQMLRALNYLHQKGLIHCDLKPGNIFVENEHVLLIDFGLAGYWGESIVGTPTYLAPEIYRGERHSVASDLYAIGVIMYNCLTRTQPFSGGSLQEVYDRHRTFTPSSISQINPKVSKYMSDIVSTLLSKKPEQRFQSAAAVIEEIAAYSKTKYTVETPETLLSYLPTTSELIGRTEVQWRIGNLVNLFLSGKGKTPYYGLYLYGGQGIGKSKFINQIKNELQLDKVPVEEVFLPLGESEKKVLEGSKAVILEDVDNYLATPDGMGRLSKFLALLESKILSTKSPRFILIVSGTEEKSWDPFKFLFPQEMFHFETIPLTPFDEEETVLFLQSIIGQKEIPQKFVEELYRNTEGNPGLCTQIIKHLIEQGLLFDAAGRWSADLLTHLETAFKKMEPPRSLEERIRKEYDSASLEEKEIIQWLAMAPQGLRLKVLEKVIGERKTGKILKGFVEKRILRLEGGFYFFYRSAYGPFAIRLLSTEEQKKRHRRLSQPDLGLPIREVFYHQSLSDDPIIAQSALENLADLFHREGKREEALEAYQRLGRTYFNAPLLQRLEWGIKSAEIFIWLNRFHEAEDDLSKLETEVKSSAESVSLKSQLLLLEKKGLALLHQEKVTESRNYFDKGRLMATGDKATRVEEARFLNDLAQIEMITGHPEKAISIFAESREKAQILSKNELKEITNNDLGHVYYQLKDYARAIDLLEEDIRMFADMQHHEPMARALYTLAEAYRAIKKYRKAIKEYERCIKICQQNHLFPILLRAYNGLGNIYLAEEKDQEALKSYQKAIEISVYLKDPMTKAALLANQGLIYRNAKNWPQASRRFLMAKQILEAKEVKLAYEQQLLSKCYDELTQIAREEKDSLKALSFQLERQQIVEKSEVLNGESFDVRYNLAELYLENRLTDSFTSEMKKLESIAHTPDENAKILGLKDRWTKIETFDQGNTMKV